MQRGYCTMIPKVIHYVWLSGDPFPDKIQRCVDSWRKKLPDYEIKQWNTSNFDIDSVLWVKQAYEHKNYELATDYIRFYVLYNEGGIYLDADVEVVKPFDSLLGSKFFFGYEFTGMPEAAVIGAKEGIPWIKKCYEWFEGRALYDEKGFHRIVCPMVMRKGFEDEYGKGRLIDVGKVRNVDGGKIYPYYFFSPKNGFSNEIIENKKTCCIHHFNSAWLSGGYSAHFRSKVHLAMIKMMGKTRYGRLMYGLRAKLHKTED